MYIFFIIIYIIISSVKSHHLPPSVTGLGMKIHDSPCPESFEYFVEHNKLQYGIVRIIADADENYTHVIVKFSVADPLQDYQGKLILVDMISLEKKRIVTYKLYFPHWFNCIPKITKIEFNEKIICSGSPLETKNGKLIETISLSHCYSITDEAKQNKLVFIKKLQKPEAQDPSIVFPDFDVSKLSDVEETNLISTKLLNHGINTVECGRSVITINLVANGRVALEGEHPWLVAIFIIKASGPEFKCGGNLLSTKIVITAAHCMTIDNEVVSPEKIFLRLGEYNIRQWTHISNSKTVGVRRIHVNPEYQFKSGDADLAILKLQDEIKFTPMIKPICLWDENSEIDGLLGSVAGWGKDETGQPTAEPKVVNLPIVSQKDCLGSHPVMWQITSDRTFCAGYKNGSGPCNGDSGGGFIIKKDDRWTLRGLVSMSVGKDRSCDYGHFFVFSDVVKFLNWILDVLK